MKLFSTVREEISKQSKQISDVLAVLAEVAEGKAEIRSTLVAVQKLEKRVQRYIRTSRLCLLYIHEKILIFFFCILDVDIENILWWVTSLDYYKRHRDIVRKRLDGTGTWFLQTTEFQAWSSDAL